MSDETNLLDYFRVVLKYRWMVLSICAIAVVTTSILSLSSPKMYSASATLAPPIENVQQRARPGLEWGFGFSGSMIANIMGVPNFAGLYIGLLGSRVVEDAIIDRLDLLQVYGTESRYLARENLRGSTTITIVDNITNIIRITVKDTDPNRAAAIANAYVDELDRQSKRLSARQAMNQRLFLENRLKEIQGKLSNFDDILSREAEIQEMLYEMLMREYELVKIGEVKNMPTIQILDKAVAPEVRMSRGTKKKTLLAGFLSSVFAVFVAFARENYAKLKEVWTGEQRRLLLKPRQRGSEDITFSTLESKRKIVASQRKRVGENSSSKSVKVEKVG